MLWLTSLASAVAPCAVAAAVVAIAAVAEAERVREKGEAVRQN